MKHKVWYDDQQEISYLELLGDFMQVELEPMYKRLHELLKGKPSRQLIVIMGKNSKVENRETRELLNKGLIDEKITEIAFVGFSATGRMVAKVLLKTGAIKTNGDFFKNQELAINWLKSKR